MKRPVLHAVMLVFCVALAACNQQTNKNQNQSAEGGRHGLRRACATEIQQYCTGQRGRERRDCLQTHQAQLSEACKTALTEKGARRTGRRHRGL
jgi:hypothetical protein